MAPPIPTISLLSDELVAIKMPWVELAASIAFSLSGSMVAGNRSSHGVTAVPPVISECGYKCTQ